MAIQKTIFGAKAPFKKQKFDGTLKLQQMPDTSAQAAQAATADQHCQVSKKFRCKMAALASIPPASHPEMHTCHCITPYGTQAVQGHIEQQHATPGGGACQLGLS